MTSPQIGQPVSRVDGSQKVNGTATYAAEFDVPGHVHAAIVRSTVGRAASLQIDTAAAQRTTGVLAVVTHRNAQKPWIVPIPGTTKRGRLDENLGATAIQLTADDLRDIDRAASEIEVHGAQYPEHLQQMVGR